MDGGDDSGSKRANRMAESCEESCEAVVVGIGAEWTLAALGKAIVFQRRWFARAAPLKFRTKSSWRRAFVLPFFGFPKDILVVWVP